MSVRVPILWRFMVVMLLLFIMPISLFTLVLQRQLRKDFDDRMQGLLEGTANGFDTMLDAELQQGMDLVHDLGLDPRLARVMLEALEAGGGEIREGFLTNAYTGLQVGVYRTSDGLVAGTDNLASIMRNQPRAWFIQALTGPRGQLILDEQGVGWQVAGPLRLAAQGNVVLVLRGRVPQVLFEGMGATFSMSLGLYGSDSRIHYHSSQARRDRNGPPPYIDAAVLGEFDRRGGKNLLTEVFYAGQRQYFLLVTSRAGFQGPVLINVTLPMAEARPFDASLYLLVLALITTLLAVFTSIILLRRVVRPLSYLSSEINRLRYRIRHGESIPSLVMESNDEINDVAQTFNGLVRDLLDSRQKIEEQRAQIVSYAQNLEERVHDRTRELEEAKIRAEIANAQKSRFLVNMNHELRTPLNSIAGITELLRFGAYDKTSEWANLFSDFLHELRQKPPVVVERGSLLPLIPFLEQLARLMSHSSNGKKAVMEVVQELFPHLRDEGDLARMQEQMDNLIEEEDRSVFYAYDTIRDASESLLNIINEVINLSRIESGVIEVHREDVRLSEIINACMAHGESYLRVKGKEQLIDLNLSMDLRLPDVVHVDGQKIKQILLNFLTNAIKYTDSGSVLVDISLDDTEVQRMIRIGVRDTGRGIDEKDKPFLFMEFSRAFEVREIEGTGLGLALSRKLAERMGGKVGVESEPGRGSYFWFTVPLLGVPEGGGSPGAQ